MNIIRPSLALALALTLALALAAPALAQILDAARPMRELRPPVIQPVDPAALRQGGSSWEQAVPLEGFPFADSGTTVGYPVSCCSDPCPVESWGPAVYYRFTPTQTVAARIDLCGSDFDTGLYVWDEDLYLIACNAEYHFGPPCGDYVSCIERVELNAGRMYYIVISGMSGESGHYVLTGTEYQECVVDIPVAAVPEGEPPLVDEYQDAYNGGCNSPEHGRPFQPLPGDTQGHLLFAGVSGWYIKDSLQTRDTDWFTAIVGESGVLDIALLAECEAYLFELAPQDCNAVGVAQQANAEDCGEATMQVMGEPGAVVWLWVGPTTFSAPEYPPGNEFDYLLTIEGLQAGPVAVERTTWSRVRALYR